jgi:hypothetical protein
MNDTETRRAEFFSGNLPDRKEDALRALDRLIGIRSCTRREKVLALREVSRTASLMAGNLERWLNEEELE